jgi:integrase
MIKHDPFQDFKVRLKPVYKGYLTEEEINRLSDVKFESRDLDRIRDIFLFACYTGLAYTDIKQLTSFHIMKDADGSYYIRKPRQKTGQEGIIPMGDE